LNILTSGSPLTGVNLMSDVRFIGAGWQSGQFSKRGMSLNAARK
jgi:MFS transporter, ACS family, hexuronate transporter